MNHADWAQHCQEKLDNDTVGYLLNHAACGDLVCFMENNLEPRKFQQLLSLWLETPVGKKWHEAMLTKLIDDAPENDDVDPMRD